MLTKYQKKQLKQLYLQGHRDIHVFDEVINHENNLEYISRMTRELRLYNKTIARPTNHTIVKQYEVNKIKE